MPKRYVLSSEIAAVKAKHPPFELQLPEVGLPGEEGYYPERTISIAALQLQPDAVMSLAVTNQVAGAKAILSPDEYDQFTKAGGSAGVLWTILQENAGASLGESATS